MIRVVLDTNVLVSGLLSENGNPAKLINAFREKRFSLLYNDDIIAEYRDVLFREKFGLNPNDIEDLIDAIMSIGLPIEARTSDVVLIDKDDHVFYETYNIDSDVYLITGNIKHYPNEKRIIKPADFLNMILDI